MKCAGFPEFKDLPEDKDRTKRDEGEAASEYFEKKVMELEIPTHSKNKQPITDEMKHLINPIVEGILAVDKANPRSTIQVETRCNWMTKAGIELAGRFDLSMEADNNLYLDDLKWGWGIVEAYKNWQLIAYAIGEVLRRGRPYNEIVMRIHQPRPHHEDGITREWRISYDKLLEYKEQIENRMAAIAGGDTTLVTGSQCKYCPAAGAACPAFNKTFYKALETAHEFVQDDITDEELSMQLDLMTRIDEIFKIKKSSLELLATTRIKENKKIPGYALIDNLGDRKWNPDVSPELIKMLTGKDITETKVLSPAQAEKIGVDKKLVADLVNRPMLGQKLKKMDSGKIGNKIFGNEQPTTKGA